MSCPTALILGLFMGVGLSAVALPAVSQETSPLDRAFVFADANHDGVVTRAEFQGSRAARFKALDRNHDGYLSLDDLPAGLGRFGRARPRLQEMLTLFDTNHDGRVSLQEFITGSMSLFDRADANHDGVLTRAEASAAAALVRSAPTAGR